MAKHRPIKELKLFNSAEEEFRQLANQEQVRSRAYQLAFADQEFLLRADLRPIRLQLELLKADLVQQESGIDSTVVIFGSARIVDRTRSKALLGVAKAELKKNPTDASLKLKYQTAKRLYEKSHYYDEARLLAKLISEESQQPGQCQYVVVTGGGPGIMEAANRGAHDICAKSIGLNIILPMEQGPNPYSSPELTFQFHYFAIRKMHFLLRARALIAFPGGYGTLDEVFEALTLMQTKKIKRMPVIFFCKKFWEKLIDFDYMVHEGVIDPEDMELFQYAETADEAWQMIKAFYGTCE